jgi:flagellar basal body-associated protein FliL
VPKQKLIIIVVVALVAVGGIYKFLLAGSSEAEAKPKIEGVVYVLPKEFLVNLADDRYAKFTVGLILDHAPVAGGHGDSPPEGYGVMPEEAVVRDIVTDVTGAAKGETLSNAEGRETVKKEIKKVLKKKTDLHVHDVVFPDITVQ